jgi:protein disulfide-isomerase A1
MVGDKVTTANIKETIEKHSSGSLPADLKSEEIPADNNGDVKILVGKNFDDIIKKSGKDVFVEFYAPWCEFSFLHCINNSHNN